MEFGHDVGTHFVGEGGGEKVESSGRAFADVPGAVSVVDFGEVVVGIGGG